MTEFNHRPLYDIDAIAKHHTQKDGVSISYVCTTALNNGTIAMDIFYRETPHPEFGNRYFGIYQNPYDLQVYITNADNVEYLEFTCGQMEDGRMTYSRHRHDMVEVDGGAIDGGRAYARVIGDVGVFTAYVKDGIMAELSDVKSAE